MDHKITPNMGPEKRPKNVLEYGEQIDVLYEEAVADMNSRRPNPEDFTDLYDKEEIISDQRQVLKLETIWKNKDTPEAGEAKKVATVAEYLILKNLEKWSGGKLQASPSSEFDDYMGKVDLILESKEEDSLENEDKIYHAMTLDVVLGSAEKFERLIEKLMKIKLSIDDAEESFSPTGSFSAAIKYFRTEKPLAETLFASGVASLSGGVVRNLVSKEFTGGPWDVENHHASFIIMTQLLEQYEGFKEYAEYVGKQWIADEYEYALSDIRESFKGLAIELSQNQEMADMVNNDPNVKNMRTFFRTLKEEYMPMKAAA